jgi:hypothetical protein
MRWRQIFLWTLVALSICAMLFVTAYPYAKNEECKKNGGTLYRSYEKGLRDLKCLQNENNT